MAFLIFVLAGIFFIYSKGLPSHPHTLRFHHPSTWLSPFWSQCSLFRTGSFSDASGTRPDCLSHQWLLPLTDSGTMKSDTFPPTISVHWLLTMPQLRSMTRLVLALLCFAQLVQFWVELGSLKYFSFHGLGHSFTRSTAQFSTSSSSLILASAWEVSFSVEWWDSFLVSWLAANPNPNNKAGSCRIIMWTHWLWSDVS